MTSTFSRVDGLRSVAEARIDECFAEAISRVIGPMGPLHFIKRQQAIAGGGTLVDDASAVLERAAEQDQALADLDRERRDWKAEVRTATSSAEIKAVLTRFEQEFSR
ncbi:hypothetical protein [Ensifer canadensis]